MLNMERMVGTITPKNVFSFRGSLLGDPALDSGLPSDTAPHATEVTLRPHTPVLIRGVRSFDMVAEKSVVGLVYLSCEKDRTEDRNRHIEFNYKI